MKSVIALDVGGTKIAGAVVTYATAGDPARVTRSCSIPTEAARGGGAVLERVCSLAERLLEETGSPLGVGVGTAGVVDPATGSIRYANEIMPGWSGQPVKSRLEQKLSVPAAVIGDVQAHALGEARWGAARGAQSCLCVAAGTGLGGAIAINGHVLLGSHGAAGHLGHTLHPAALHAPCACGRESHVESIASGTAIAAAFQKRAFLDKLDPEFMGDRVSQRANEGDLEALAIIEEAGRALGEAVGSWCNIIDPELVVLSGSVTKAGPIWRRAVDEGFKSQVIAPLADTPLVYAALGDDAPLVGAAEHLLDTLQDGL